MAIEAADLHYRHSGGAANADPDASLGGTKSSVSITTNSDNNLFDDVTGDEAGAGDTEYRLYYLHNNHGTITLQNSKHWFTANTTSADDTLDIALAAAGLNGTAETLADESTAPTGGETFSAPASKAAGLNTGNVPAGQHYGIFIRRTVSASAAAIDANSATLRWEGDTAA